MAQALPKNINLAAQKPQAVPSYVRRFRNIQTNSSGANGQQVDIIIPLDTSTPGAFLDCAQSFLQYDLLVTNGNPYIDYVTFGKAGGNAVFETMTIRSNGNPIETIRDYNTVFETWMHLEGLAQEEFSLYSSRKETYSMGIGHIQNPIDWCKAPMVDMSGRIMASTGGQVITNSFNAGQDPVPPTYNTGPNVWSQNETSYSADQTGGLGWQPTYAPYNSLPFLTGPFPSLNFTGGIFNGNIRNWPKAPGAAYGSLGNPAFGAGYQSSSIGCAENILYWPQSIGVQPMEEIMYSKNNLRFQDYMTFLANVKCIPVGCTTSMLPITSSTATTNTTGGWAAPIPNVQGTKNYNDGSFAITLCVPVLSGLIGVLAEKMAPTMLCDRLELIMTTTSYGKAFKVSMDPCRRIVGTHRDYSVYAGNNLGSINLVPPTTYNGANILLPAMMTSQLGFTQAGPIDAGGSPAQQNQYQVPLPIMPWALNRGFDVVWDNLVNPGTLEAGNTFLNQNMFFPRGSGVPQYYHHAGQALGIYPINLNDNVGFIGNDMNGCYGTFLESSVPQTARCVRNTTKTLASHGLYTIPQWTDSQQGDPNAMPTFQISNAYFVATQVIIPDAITAEILQNATRGDISLQTHTVVTYNNIQLTNGSPSQNIVIPAKVGSANALYGIFRSNEQTAYGIKQYLVNSLSGICPIGSCVLVPDQVSYIGTNTPPINGAATYVSTTAGKFSFQLKLGNDLIPAQPINSATELLVELEKCNHGLNSRYNNMAFGNPVYPSPNVSIGQPSGELVYDIFTHGGYFTTYVDPYMLNDQTIVNNAKWGFCGPTPPTPSYNYVGVATGTIVLPSSGPTYSDANWFPTPVGTYMINRFVHPDGCFIVGLDLDTWSGMSDVALSGRYLGNNPVSLACEGLTLVKDLASSGGAQNGSVNTINFTAMIMCDARWSFQAGGNTQVFI